jgi:predicted RNase H-like HicB family nuclease
MLTAYIDAAMRHARTEWLPEDREWYAHIPALRGVLATGETEQAARAALREALESWIAVRLRRGLALPPIDGRTIDVALAG